MNTSSLEIVHKIYKDSVHKYIVIKSEDGNSYITPASAVIAVKTDTLIYNANDALYSVFARRVRSGININNYKSSKHYKMYLERALIEDPDLLI